VREHFARRYHGAAFKEWVSDLFDLREARLRQARSVCQQKRRLARNAYARIT